MRDRPTVQSTRKPKYIPLVLVELLKKKLVSLQGKGIITPIETNTEWIRSLVRVRIHYPLPTIENILPDLFSGKVFIVCEVKNGF